MDSPENRRYSHYASIPPTIAPNPRPSQFFPAEGAVNARFELFEGIDHLLIGKRKQLHPKHPAYPFFHIEPGVRVEQACPRERARCTCIR